MGVLSREEKKHKVIRRRKPGREPFRRDRPQQRFGFEKESGPLDTVCLF